VRKISYTEYIKPLPCLPAGRPAPPLIRGGSGWGRSIMAKNSVVLPKAKILRKSMTEVEEIFWEQARNKKINGLKIRRQMPLAFGNYHYIADFYCAEKKIIIEIDGGIHEDTEIKELDRFREDVLKTAGYKVIRFKNEDVKYNIRAVLLKIKQESTPLPALS
jgi:very-short-patch-repair endonuclease